MDILTLMDAVRVAVREFDADRVIAAQEFGQKCWIPEKGSPQERMKSFIEGIRPEMIAKKIQNDELTEWCASIRIEMLIALREMSD